MTESFLVHLLRADPLVGEVQLLLQDGDQLIGRTVHNAATGLVDLHVDDRGLRNDANTKVLTAQASHVLQNRVVRFLQQALERLPCGALFDLDLMIVDAAFDRNVLVHVVHVVQAFLFLLAGQLVRQRTLANVRAQFQTQVQQVHRFLVGADRMLVLFVVENADAMVPDAGTFDPVLAIGRLLQLVLALAVHLRATFERFQSEPVTIATVQAGSQFAFQLIFSVDRIQSTLRLYVGTGVRGVRDRVEIAEVLLQMIQFLATGGRLNLLLHELGRIQVASHFAHHSVLGLRLQLAVESIVRVKQYLFHRLVKRFHEQLQLATFGAWLTGLLQTVANDHRDVGFREDLVQFRVDLRGIREDDQPFFRVHQ